MRYLKSTNNYALVFDGAIDGGLIAFSDSDWVSDPNNQRSTTGMFLKLAGGIILWQSHAQKTIALSSTEAEYIVISNTAR